MDHPCWLESSKGDPLLLTCLRHRRLLRQAAGVIHTDFEKGFIKAEKFANRVTWE